jgi:hypothetical protein
MLRKVLFALTTLIAITGTLAVAQVKQGKTRPARTSHLMKAAIKPNCDALKKATEAAPADDKAWKALAANAAVINELSYSIMEDGRSPDQKWADACKQLQAGSAEAIKACEAKDASALKIAFGATMKSCKPCHDAHKEK